MDYCQQNGIVVQAYSPLIRAQKGMYDHPTITAIALKHGKDNAQVLIRWTLQKGCGISCLRWFRAAYGGRQLHRWVTLPKSSDPSRIISNAAVYDFELDKKDMIDLDSLDRGDDGSVTWHPVHTP